MKTVNYLLLWLVCHLSVGLVAIRSLWACFTNKEKAWQIFLRYDWLVNTAANDHEDQSISTRAAKAQRDNKRWGNWLCRFLDRIDPDHCAKNIGDK